MRYMLCQMIRGLSFPDLMRSFVTAVIISMTGKCSLGVLLSHKEKMITVQVIPESFIKRNREKTDQ